MRRGSSIIVDSKSCRECVRSVCEEQLLSCAVPPLLGTNHLLFAPPHSLGVNMIGDEGGVAIGEALKYNKTLTVLV